MGYIKVPLFADDITKYKILRNSPKITTKSVFSKVANYKSS